MYIDDMCVCALVHSHIFLNHGIYVSLGTSLSCHVRAVGGLAAGSDCVPIGESMVIWLCHSAVEGQMSSLMRGKGYTMPLGWTMIQEKIHRELCRHILMNYSYNVYGLEL